jgi:hypothetical protein
LQPFSFLYCLGSTGTPLSPPFISLTIQPAIETTTTAAASGIDAVYHYSSRDAITLSSTRKSCNL